MYDLHWEPVDLCHAREGLEKGIEPVRLAFFFHLLTMVSVTGHLLSQVFDIGFDAGGIGGRDCL